MRFSDETCKEVAGLLNLLSAPLESKRQEVADRVAETLTEYSTFIIFLEHSSRSETSQAKSNVLREQLVDTMKVLKDMREETLEELLLGYTLSTPLDFEDDVWSWGTERKERENDLKHTIKISQDVMRSLVRFLDAVEKRYAGNTFPRGLKKRHQKEVCQRLQHIFHGYYREIPGEDPLEAKLDFIKFAFGEWNKENIWSEPLPTTRRSLLTLLKE